MIRMAHDAALMVFARSMGLADVLRGRKYPLGNFIFVIREERTNVQETDPEGNDKEIVK